MRMIALAAVAFITTNIDDMLLLIGFFSARDYRPRAIVMGQYLGLSIIVMLSLGCALGMRTVPPPFIGLLGLAPICLGLARLRRPDRSAPPLATARRPVLTVVIATIANGGDNVASYTPMFAGNSDVQTLAMLGVFAVMTGVWCWTARTMVSHPTLGRPFQRWGLFVLPYLLIGIGVIAMWKNNSFSLLVRN